MQQSIADILVELKFITPEDKAAIAEQGIPESRISEFLIEKGTITREQVSRALAKQLSLLYIPDITEQMADTTLLSKVPLKFLRKHNVVPLIYEGSQYIVTSDPRDIQPLDDIMLLVPEITKQAVASPEKITETINRYYPLESSKEMMDELKEEDDSDINLGDIEEKDIMEMANDAPIVKLVNHILYQAVKDGASDIHIEAYEKELRVRYRVDGAMHVRFNPPKRYLGAIVSRIKIMSNLNIAEKRIPQDGRIQIKVANKPWDVRVSILPCAFGERVVMRMLDKSRGAVSLDKLGFSDTNFDFVSKAIERPNGIILVSGPTGSGKTTTLYSILNHLNRPDTNIITVENPVEYTITGINQVQVNEKVGLTFAAALRSILRQDPDIVLIGEIRDAETAKIATEAALTGHLVLSTIHTNSAPATVTRLVEMGVEPFLVASALVAVLSQRLVRRLDDNKEEYTPDTETIRRLGITSDQANGKKFYRQKPNPTITGSTGYKGRAAIHEVMVLDEEMASMIIKGEDTNTLKDAAVKAGMIPLTLDGVRLINDGITSVEEVLSVSYIEEADDDETFKKAAKENPEEQEKKEHAPTEAKQ